MAYHRSKELEIMRKEIAVAALVASTIIPIAASAADSMGRLFFTPAQRSVLDAGKYVSTQKAPVKPGPKTVRLDGVVTRSDADRTVWINGMAYHGGSPDGVQVRTNPATPASTSIRVPGKTAASRVKVGQRLDLNSGQIREDFSRQPMASDKAEAAAQNPGSSPPTANKPAVAQNALPPIDEAEKPAKRREGTDREIGKDAPAVAR